MNFATVVRQENRLLLYGHVNPDKIAPLPSNGRDVRQSFQWGTGDVELSLMNKAEFNAAKPLTLMIYERLGAGGEISKLAAT